MPARAISNRRCCAYGNCVARSSARWARPTISSASCALRSMPASLCLCRALVVRILKSEVELLQAAATFTFSITLRLSKIRMFWNVRARPSRAIRCGLRRNISWPPTQMEPASACEAPLSALSKVVLPEPLGPMMACTMPLGTSRSIPSNASSPPNRRVTPRAVMIGTAVNVRSPGVAAGAKPAMPDLPVPAR